MIIDSKRRFIKSGLVTALSFMGVFNVIKNKAIAEDKSQMMIQHLIDALNSTSKPVCINAASKLQSLNNNSSFDLHLRSAGLSSEDIIRIANAIQILDKLGGPTLQSFSMSYNPQLKDQGVLQLVASLPSTLTELGLVGCGISDIGGEALVTWAANTSKLHWLCVEQNALTDATKNKLMQLGKTKSGLLVIV